MVHDSLSSRVLCFDVMVLSLVSCVLMPCRALSVSPVFFPLCSSLLWMFVSPCLPALFPLWFPFVISPAVPPHLLLVSSLVSVYLVFAFPLVFVSSLFLFLLMFSCFYWSLWLLSGFLICFGFGFLFFSMFDLNFALDLYFAFLFALCSTVLLLLCFLETFSFVHLVSVDSAFGLIKLAFWSSLPCLLFWSAFGSTFTFPL